MYCEKCGTANDDFQTVCTECGKPLTPGFVMCPLCGKVLREGDSTCPRCKASLTEKTVSIRNRVEKVAVTPKYVVKTPFSMPPIISVLSFFLYSLVYNIVILAEKIGSTYQGMELKDILYLILSSEIRPFVLLTLSVLSVITFIKRVTVNRITDYQALEKRLTTLKAFILADVTGFFTYFMVSFWPSVFANGTPIYYLGAVLGILSLVFSIVSLPIFFKKARVRSR